MSIEILFDSREKNSTPEVSVIIPYYNMHAFLDEALDSVLNQSFTNFEIIVIDDGSDQSEAVRYIDELSKKKLLVLRTENQGVSVARNTAILQSKGGYILPLDPDDVLHPDFMSKCLSEIKNNSAVGVVYSSVNMFGELNEVLSLSEAKLPEMLFDNAVVVTAIYRKKHWVEFGGYNKDMTSGLEDYEFWMNFFKAGLSFKKVEEVLFYYRIKNSSRSTNLHASPAASKSMVRNIYSFHKDLYLRHIDELFENWLALKYPPIQVKQENSTNEKKKSKKIFSLNVSRKKKLRMYLETKE